MIFQRPLFNVESIVFFILVLITFITSIYYTFKYSINEQFRKLNKKISEITELEKE
jgi:cell division protein FtsL